MQNCSVCIYIICRCDSLQQWFLTFVTQMFLNCNSQKPQPAQLVVKTSGSCSPILLSNPRLRTSDLNNIPDELEVYIVNRFALLNSTGCEPEKLWIGTRDIIKEECKSIIPVVKKKRKIYMDDRRNT